VTEQVGEQAASDAALPALRHRIEGYYSAKVQAHGATPLGVDWSCTPTQELRFVQLLRLCDFSRPFSLDDLGCGYGALLGFMGRRHRGHRADYLGIDLSPSMIDHAQQLWRKHMGAAFCVGARSPRVADYAVASGLFNVKLDEPAELWTGFIEATLKDMAAGSRLGLAVNFLAPLPEGMEGKPELYRTGPQPWVRYCERTLGRRVTVLASYGMREFTLLAST